MITRIFVLIMIVGGVFCSPCYGQSDTVPRQKTLPYRHSVGIQINPYINSFYIRSNKYPTVFAIRYGFQLKNNFSFGPEFSLWNADVPFYKSSIYKIGVYARYSFLRKLNFQPFIEANGFYYYENTLHSVNGMSSEKIGGGVDYFLAPGFTFYFFKKHIGLDLLFKWNHKNGIAASLGPFEFSYRLSYHFDHIKFK